MARNPSIKGSVFAGVVDEVKKLMAKGDVSPEEASRWLKPGDLEFLDAKISIASWYDIGVFNRFSEMLRDVKGSGSYEYLRGLGRESARRLLEAGLYSQLEYLQRTQVAEAQERRARFEAFGRDLRRLATMSNAIYNFSKWTPEKDPKHEFRYVIVLTDAEAFSDVLCWRAEGFMNEMAMVHGISNLWAWERSEDNEVRFHMTRDL